LGGVNAEEADILTPEALAFVAELAREFEPRRRSLMHARAERQAQIDAGHVPDFLPDTSRIRSGKWRVAPVVAVRGNGDYRNPVIETRPGVPDDPRVHTTVVLNHEGFKIGLAHVFPTDNEVPWSGLDGIMGRIFAQRVDIVVCGDTHVEQIVQSHGVFLVNPGSPNLPRNLTELGTVAVLDVERGRPPRAQIINLREV
jgi:putative phosphoesterase